MSGSVRDRRLEIARAAALEWRERYRKVLASQDAIWNLAVDNSIDLFGMRHDPMHTSHACLLCFVHRKLQSTFRLENAGYLPVRDRLLASVKKLETEAYSHRKSLSRDSYVEALDDVRNLVKEIVIEGI